MTNNHAQDARDAQPGSGRLAAALWLAVFLTGCGSTVSADHKAATVGALADLRPAQSGCVCEFYADDAQSSAVLISDIEGKDAWFNLNGSDVKLVLNKTNHSGRQWRDETAFERVYVFEDRPVMVAFDVIKYHGQDFYLGGRPFEGWEMAATIAYSSVNVSAKGACGC